MRKPRLIKSSVFSNAGSWCSMLIISKPLPAAHSTNCFSDRLGKAALSKPSFMVLLSYMVFWTEICCNLEPCYHNQEINHARDETFRHPFVGRVRAEYRVC